MRELIEGLWPELGAQGAAEKTAQLTVSFREMLEAFQGISDAITILLVAAGIVMVLVVFFQALFIGVKSHVPP
jgi:hypothetical protein